MNARPWIHRGMAAAALVLAGLALTSGVAILGDVRAVQAARSAAPPSAPQLPARAEVAGLRPVLLSRGAAPEVALGEFLNLRFSDLGLFVSAVDTVSLRPLGQGLSLVEVRVTAAGASMDLASVSNWVAVNREAIRMKSFTMAGDADGRGAFSFVLLVVVA